MRRDRSCSSGYLPKRATVARDLPGKHRVLKLHVGLRPGWQGPEYLDHLLLPFQSQPPEAGPEVK